MAAQTNSLDQVRRRFRTKKVITLADLAGLMQCSHRTVQRRLHVWQAINSYNKNGRYYALPDVPQFDTHGLWHYRGIGFSRYGNLTETLIQLVRNSQAGLSAAELGDLLAGEPRSFLSLFRNHPALKRESHRGRLVYFSAEPGIFRRQNRQRRTMTTGVQRPTDAEVIAILVHTIKHPQLSVEELCKRLKKQGVRVTEQALQNLFVAHGLEVKKTRRSPS